MMMRVLSLLFVCLSVCLGYMFQNCRTVLTKILYRDGGLSKTLSRILVLIVPVVPPEEPKMYRAEMLCRSCTDQLVLLFIVEVAAEDGAAGVQAVCSVAT